MRYGFSAQPASSRQGECRFRGDRFTERRSASSKRPDSKLPRHYTPWKSLIILSFLILPVQDQHLPVKGLDRELVRCSSLPFYGALRPQRLLRWLAMNSKRIGGHRADRWSNATRGHILIVLPTRTRIEATSRTTWSSTEASSHASSPCGNRAPIAILGAVLYRGTILSRWHFLVPARCVVSPARRADRPYRLPPRKESCEWCHWPRRHENQNANAC